MSKRYVFISCSPVTKTEFTNTASSLFEARRERRWLKDRGCAVGTIVAVPLPKASRRKTR